MEAGSQITDLVAFPTLLAQARLALAARGIPETKEALAGAILEIGDRAIVREFVLGLSRAFS